MLGHSYRRLIAAGALFAAAAGWAAAGEIYSTMRNVNAVVEAHGFQVVPAYDVTVAPLPADLSPGQAFEITRPDGKPVTIGRLFTSCTCIQLQAHKRTFAAGERAILQLRNTRPTPANGQVYAIFVQITSPVRTTLRFDTFVQSRQPGMPDPVSQSGAQIMEESAGGLIGGGAVAVNPAAPTSPTSRNTELAAQLQREIEAAEAERREELARLEGEENEEEDDLGTLLGEAPLPIPAIGAPQVTDGRLRIPGSTGVNPAAAQAREGDSMDLSADLDGDLPDFYAAGNAPPIGTILNPRINPSAAPVATGVNPLLASAEEEDEFEEEEDDDPIHTPPDALLGQGLDPRAIDRAIAATVKPHGDEDLGTADLVVPGGAFTPHPSMLEDSAQARAAVVAAGVNPAPEAQAIAPVAQAAAPVPVPAPAPGVMVATGVNPQVAPQQVAQQQVLPPQMAPSQEVVQQQQFVPQQQPVVTQQQIPAPQQQIVQAPVVTQQFVDPRGAEVGNWESPEEAELHGIEVNQYALAPDVVLAQPQVHPQLQASAQPQFQQQVQPQMIVQQPVTEQLVATQPVIERNPNARKPVQAVSMITIGVRDMQSAVRFYEALGWRRAARGKYDQTAFFQLQGQVLALYPMNDLLREQNMPNAVPTPGGVTLALHVQDKADVWSVYQRFMDAGGESLRPPAEMASGAVSCYVADPDGNAWEISWVPQFRIDDEGGLWLP